MKRNQLKTALIFPLFLPKNIVKSGKYYLEVHCKSAVGKPRASRPPVALRRSRLAAVKTGPARLQETLSAPGGVNQAARSDAGAVGATCDDLAQRVKLTQNHRGLANKWFIRLRR
jgi:hypothetical protein